MVWLALRLKGVSGNLDTDDTDTSDTGELFLICVHSVFVCDFHSFTTGISERIMGSEEYGA